jgi:hypothetical protein
MVGGTQLMNQLVPFAAHHLPAVLVAAGDSARVRFIEFFTANIRNRNTRRAYEWRRSLA